MFEIFVEKLLDHSGTEARSHLIFQLQHHFFPWGCEIPFQGLGKKRRTNLSVVENYTCDKTTNTLHQGGGGPVNKIMIHHETKLINRNRFQLAWMTNFNFFSEM